MAADISPTMGQRYYRWKAIGHSEKKGYVKCQCECGTVRDVRKDGLISGKSRSCGCLKNELIRQAKFDDLTGRRFGRLRVLGLDEADEKRNKWVCSCDCGNYRTVHRTQLVQGKVEDCQSQKNHNICLLRSA